MLFRLLFLLLMSVTLMSNPAFSAERWGWHDHLFQNFTTKDGLPNGAISAITQDNNGFIWLSTSNGLMRFDGHSFERVKSQQLKNQGISVLTRDPKGTIWLGTGTGLIGLNPSTRVLSSYELLPKQSVSISAISMNTHANSPDAWIGSNKGVFRFNTMTADVTSYLTDEMVSGTNWRIFSVLAADDGTVWVGTSKGLLYKKTDDEQFTFFDLSSKLSSSKRISDLIQDSSGNIWVGTPGNGVIVIATDMNLTQPTIPNFSKEWIYSIAEISPGIIWLGTYGHGVIQMNADGKNVVRIVNDRLNPNSLRNNEIWTVYKADDAMVWLGSSKGLSLHDSTQTAVKSLFGDTNRRQGISDANINSLLEDKQGNVWLGLRAKGIDIVNPMNGIVKHIVANTKTPEIALPVGAIESMALHPSGDIYIGSNWGVYRYSQSRLLRIESPERQAEQYTGVVEIIDKALWAGGTDGIWRFGVDENKRVVANDLSNIVRDHSDIRTTVIKELPSSERVIGSWNGLSWLNSKGELSYKLANDNQASTALSNSFISAILVDQQNRLWISTEGNGVFIGEAGEHPTTFTQLTKEQGLSSNVVRSMLFDDQGHVWLSSGAGIDVVNINDLSIRSLQRQEGALFAPYYRQASLKTSHGELMFGGSGGITIVDPTLWQADTQFHPITVAESHIGSLVDFNPALGTNVSKPIIVKAYENEISIAFTTLDFIATSRTQYRYRLLGLNDKWHHRDSQSRVAAFTTLPPGHYQLEIQNTNRAGDWNPQSHVINIQVLPFWYQTLLAKIAAALLIILFILLSVKWRTNRLQKRQLYLEEQVRKRTLSLQQATDELDAISMTDPLTGMKNRRYLERTMPYEVAGVLEKYQSSATQGERIDGADLVFILIDIDHFKRVNDKYGHQSGDAVLVEITKRIRLIARDTDHLIRWGGEEFLLIVRESSIGRAEVIANRLRQQVKKLPVQLNKSTQIQITCSIGLCAYPLFARQPDNIGWLECVNLADKALYSAKNSGRDAWISVKENELTLSDQIPKILEDIKQEHVNIDSSLEHSLIDAHWKFS